VGPNEISKKSNNVVISSPRVLIFSYILVPKDSFLHVWSRNLERFRSGRQGATKFFKNLIFSATAWAISEIFSGSCAPRRPLLKFRGTWGRGSNLGARSPEWKFFIFFCGTSPWAGGGGNISSGYHSIGGPFDVWNLKKNSSIFFGENWVQIFGGWGTLSSSPPSGAFVPHPTLADFGPRDPDKMVFVRGDRPPFGGDMGFGRCALWPTFCRIVE